MIGRSVRRARVVTVPSEYVRGSVIEAYDAEPSQRLVVPHGFEPDLLSRHHRARTNCASGSRWVTGR